MFLYLFCGGVTSSKASYWHLLTSCHHQGHSHPPDYWLQNGVVFRDTEHWQGRTGAGTEQQSWYKLHIDSLAPGKFEWNFIYVIFIWIIVIDGWGISCEIAPIWMSLDFTDDQSTLVQVMAWCRQATSHYLSQCWPRSKSPYGVSRLQWVKDICTRI